MGEKVNNQLILQQQLQNRNHDHPQNPYSMMYSLNYTGQGFMKKQQ